MSKAEEMKAIHIQRLLNNPTHHFIRFKGAPYMSLPTHTFGMVPFNQGDFNRFLDNSTEHKGFTNNKKKDWADTIKDLAPDWTEYSHRIAFGEQLWDAQALAFIENDLKYVYSTRTPTQSADSAGYRAAKEFLLQLAAGDDDLAYDYQQAMAPIFMYTRPQGIIWFIGDGANGKSSLLKVLDMTFEPYLASQSTADMEDGRDTPSLIGKLANIVNEASEKRVEDDQVYKAIGTHDAFTVHEFNKQGGIKIKADFHTIFNANNVPLFSDKTGAARRRTITVPFPAHFKDDPTFEQRTFTPEFLGGMLTLFLEAARDIRGRGYKYDWSEQTQAMKQSYDDSVNSANSYVDYIESKHVRGFYNWRILLLNYQDWCAINGHTALYLNNLKVSMKRFTPVKRAVRDDDKVYSRFVFDPSDETPLVWIDGYAFHKAEEKLPEPTPALSQRLSGEW